MKRALMSLMGLLLIVAGSSLAQDLSLELKGGDAKKIQVDVVTITKVDALQVTSFPFTVSGPKGALAYKWVVPKGVESLDKDDVLQVLAAPRGNLTVELIAKWVDFDAKVVVSKAGSLTFIVGGVDPPTPPEPPKPPTPPEPPTPPAPIPAAGFRVMIIEEKKNRAKVPPLQLATLSDSRVHNYLDSVCVKVAWPDGTQKSDWWFVDRHASMLGVPGGKMWQDVVSPERADYPWLVISDGTTGYSGPLPPNAEETLVLIKKFAERKGASRGQ